MPLFDVYVGIDYSGAGRPGQRVTGLRVCVARGRGRIRPPWGANRRCSRHEVAHWLAERLGRQERQLIGIDHAFGYPRAALTLRERRSRCSFLKSFEHAWPTRERRVRDCLGMETIQDRDPSSLRLTDTWTQTAMSVFKGWRATGSNVFFSTHAGIPWLRWLKTQHARVHLWPFDGFEVPPGASVIAEVYPRIFRRRYQTPYEQEDLRDAYLIAKWFQDRDQRDLLHPYFNPALSPNERSLARIEGWILGVM